MTPLSLNQYTLTFSQVFYTEMKIICFFALDVHLQTSFNSSNAHIWNTTPDIPSYSNF